MADPVDLIRDIINEGADDCLAQIADVLGFPERAAVTANAPEDLATRLRSSLDGLPLHVHKRKIVRDWLESEIGRLAEQPVKNAHGADGLTRYDFTGQRDRSFGECVDGKYVLYADVQDLPAAYRAGTAQPVNPNADDAENERASFEVWRKREGLDFHRDLLAAYRAGARDNRALAKKR